MLLDRFSTDDHSAGSEKYLWAFRTYVAGLWSPSLWYTEAEYETSTGVLVDLVSLGNPIFSGFSVLTGLTVSHRFRRSQTLL